MCGSGVIRRGFYRVISSYSSFNSLRARCGDAGPDFRFERDGVTVSVEAIAPEPRGLPDHWLTGLAPGQFWVGSVPHDEVLLRWTATFKEKWRQDYQQRASSALATPT
jgi:hypothetical protein